MSLWLARRGSWAVDPRPVLAVVIVLLVSCGSSSESGAQEFGQVQGSVTELVGTDLEVTRVVSMPCIPSRRDPVGVWLTIRVESVAVSEDQVELGLQSVDARLGSHPSGCRDPEILLPQSVFLIGDGDPVFASMQERQGSSERLIFDLEGTSSNDVDLIILPTLAFEKQDGDRETTIFGLIGRYSLD